MPSQNGPTAVSYACWYILYTTKSITLQQVVKSFFFSNRFVMTDGLQLSLLLSYFFLLITMYFVKNRLFNRLYNNCLREDSQQILVIFDFLCIIVVVFIYWSNIYDIKVRTKIYSHAWMYVLAQHEHKLILCSQLTNELVILLLEYICLMISTT